MNEKQNENLDEEIVEIDTSDDEAVETDSEFEYDDDGNIIIPEVIEDEDEDIEIEQDEDEDIEIEQDEDEEVPDEGDDGEDSPKDEAEPTEEAKPIETKDERDAKIAELEAKLKKLESQGKETLSKLGVKTDDLLDGLESLAAESEDITVEEYRKQRTEAERTAEAQRVLQKIEFDKKAATDLIELQQSYPETKGLKSILEIENVAEFGRLRDLGLTAKQAYAAANPDGVKSRVAEAVKQQSLNNTKKHLQSAVPKGSKDTSVTMTRSQLAEWRDLFPKLNDKEIAALYKQANSK